MNISKLDQLNSVTGMEGFVLKMFDGTMIKWKTNWWREQRHVFHRFESEHAETVEDVNQTKKHNLVDIITHRHYHRSSSVTLIMELQSQCALAASPNLSGVSTSLKPLIRRRSTGFSCRPQMILDHLQD